MKDKVIFTVILGLSLAFTGVLAASPNGSNTIVDQGAQADRQEQAGRQDQASQVEQQTQTANQGADSQIQTKTNNQIQSGAATGQVGTGIGTVAEQQAQQGLGDGSGAGSQTQNQNQVQNQGEPNQAKAGQQNGQQGQTAQDRRSQVANAVQALLQIADRNGGIGQQVRKIAQVQNQYQEELEASLEKVEKRGAFAKFFIGPDYGEINKAKKTLAENQEQINKLNEIKNQLANQEDERNLTEQIQALTQANLGIQNALGAAQKGFSLFGWLSRLLAD